MGSVEQPIDGRAPPRSFRRRDDPAVGQDHGLAPRPPSRGVLRRKIRPRNADVTGRPSGRRVKPALASTPRNAKRGDKRARSSNPGKAQFGLRTQFGPLISPTISGGCGGKMTKPRMRHRARRPTAASRGRTPRGPSSHGHHCLFMPTSCLPVRVLFRPASLRRRKDRNGARPSIGCSTEPTPSTTLVESAARLLRLTMVMSSATLG